MAYFCSTITMRVVSRKYPFPHPNIWQIDANYCNELRVFDRLCTKVTCQRKIMKRLLLLLFYVLSGTMLAMLKPGSEEPMRGVRLPQGEGWYIENQTELPISMAWYSSAIGISWTGRSYAYGDKIKLSEAITLEPDERRFVPFWPEAESGKRRQLLMTQSGPSLLDRRIEAGDDGTIINELLRGAIVVTDKHQLGDQYESHQRNVKTIYLRTKPGQALFSVGDASSKKAGWSFENKTDIPVYLRWYEAPYVSEQERFANPQAMREMVIISIKPHETKRISLPDKQEASSQRQLVCSFDQNMLRDRIESPQEQMVAPPLAAFTRHKLNVSRQWYIVEQDHTPTLLPLNRRIKVINTLNEPLFCAMYYHKDDQAKKAFPDIEIEIAPQLRAELQYPEHREGMSIKLFIVPKEFKHLLRQNVLEGADLDRVYMKDFSKTNLINWYLEGSYYVLYDVIGKPLKLQVVSVGGGGLVRAVTRAFDIPPFTEEQIHAFEEMIIQRDPLFMPSEEIIKEREKKDNTTLLQPSKLGLEEDYTQNRTEFVRKAINKFMEDDELIKPGEYVPKIALVFSGGGYRAMIETIGYLCGAEQTGVFNCCQYMCGLSGSTWAIIPLVVSGKRPSNFSVRQKPKVGHGSLRELMNLTIANEDYRRRRFIQSRYGQYHSPVGLYGHTLAQQLLDGFVLNGRRMHDIRLSDLKSRLEGYMYPLPISVAVDAGTTQSIKDRRWYEFSPFYIGTWQESGNWVISPVFGCTFEGGEIKHMVPEYPLAQYLGIWGSAFALTPEDIEKSKQPAGIVAHAMRAITTAVTNVYNKVFGIEPTPIVCKDRPAVGQVPNFSYKLEEKNQYPGLVDNTHLCLIDAGITKEDKYRHNLATIPAMARGADILIICDSPADPDKDVESNHLQAASQEAIALGYPFPQIHIGSMHDDTIKRAHVETSSIFIEEGRTIVIYMKGKTHPTYRGGTFNPDASQARFTDTKNFNYSADQFGLLSGLTQYIFEDSQTVGNIKHAITEALKRRRAMV